MVELKDGFHFGHRCFDENILEARLGLVVFSTAFNSQFICFHSIITYKFSNILFRMMNKDLLRKRAKSLTQFGNYSY